MIVQMMMALIFIEFDSQLNFCFFFLLKCPNSYSFFPINRNMNKLFDKDRTFRPKKKFEQGNYSYSSYYCHYYYYYYGFFFQKKKEKTKNM